MTLPLIELCMIVRNDSRSLARALESAKPHVDAISIDIDQRTTDPDTEIVARRYTNNVTTFGASDIGLLPEHWEAGLIHFANARNLGRSRTKAPWVLVLDSEEYLKCDVDLRALVRRYMFTNYNSFSPMVCLPGFEFRDAQRLARSNLRWSSPTHNQLVGAHPTIPIDVQVIQDLSLRSKEDQERRVKQRDEGMILLRPLAEKGDQNAVYHLAKHETVRGDLEEGARWALEYLKQTSPHSTFSDNRATLCLSIAFQYQQREAYQAAEMWAVRALFDGPHEDAFALLADLSRYRSDESSALVWESAIGFAPPRDRMRVR